MKFEYRVDTYIDKNIQQNLDLMGQLEWELVSAQKEADQWHLIFKKPLTIRRTKVDVKLPFKAAQIDLSEDDKKLIHECFNVICQEKRASTSNLQRRLRLGYDRAAYVIDYLEKVGVIAPGDGAKPREILVDLETYMLDL